MLIITIYQNNQYVSGMKMDKKTFGINLKVEESAWMCGNA